MSECDERSSPGNLPPKGRGSLVRVVTPTAITQHQSPSSPPKAAIVAHCARALAENSLCPVAGAESEPGLKNEA